MTMDNYGNRIKTQRSGRMSQSELAEEIGRDRWRIADYENNKSYPNTQELDIMCDLFGCSADYLLCRIDYPTHEITDICTASGLTEDAAETLQTLQYLARENKNSAATAVLQTINDLIMAIDPSRPEESALADIHGFIHADENTLTDDLDRPLDLWITNQKTKTGLHPKLDELVHSIYKDRIYDKLRKIPEILKIQALKKRNQ